MKRLIELQQTTDGTFEPTSKMACQVVARSIIQEKPYLQPANHERETILAMAETEAFLKTVDVDKEVFAEYLWSMPQPESIARGCRLARSNPTGKTTRVSREQARLAFERHWYDLYLMSDHWSAVRARARSWWNGIGVNHCIFDRTHKIEQWHHQTYQELGRSMEWRTIIPICGECHESITGGPRLPIKCPSAVKRWIDR